MSSLVSDPPQTPMPVQPTTQLPLSVQQWLNSLPAADPNTKAQMLDATERIVRGRRMDGFAFILLISGFYQVRVLLGLETPCRSHGGCRYIYKSNKGNNEEGQREFTGLLNAYFGKKATSWKRKIKKCSAIFRPKSVLVTVTSAGVTDSAPTAAAAAAPTHTATRTGATAMVEVYPWEDFWIDWLSTAEPTPDFISGSLLPTHFTDSIVSGWMGIRLPEFVQGPPQTRFDWLRDWLRTAGSVKEENAALSEAKRRRASHLPEQEAAAERATAEAEAAARAATTERLRLEKEAAAVAVAQAAQQLDLTVHAAKQAAERRQAERKADLAKKQAADIENLQNAFSAEEAKVMKAAEAASLEAADAQRHAAELEQQVPALPSAAFEDAARENANQLQVHALKIARENAQKAAQKASTAHQQEQVHLTKLRSQHKLNLQERRAQQEQQLQAEVAEEDAEDEAVRAVVEQQRRAEQQAQRRLEHLQHRLAEEAAGIIRRIPFCAGQMELLPFQHDVQLERYERGFSIVTGIPGVDAQPPYLDQHHLYPSKAYLWSMKLASVVLDNSTDAKSSQLKPLPMAVPPRSVQEMFDLAEKGTATLQYAKHHEYSKKQRPYCKDWCPAPVAAAAPVVTVAAGRAAPGRKRASREAATAASAAAAAGTAAAPDQQIPQSNALREELYGRVTSLLRDAHTGYVRMHAARVGTPRLAKTAAGDFEGTPMPRSSSSSCLVWRDCTWLKSKCALRTDKSDAADASAAALMLLLLDHKAGLPVLVCVPRFDARSITFYAYADTKLTWSGPHSCAPHPPRFHPMNFDALRSDPRSLLSLKDAPRMPGFDTVYWYDKNGDAHFCIHVEQLRACFVHHVICGTFARDSGSGLMGEKGVCMVVERANGRESRGLMCDFLALCFL